MTREPRATVIHGQIRADGNTLIFNNLKLGDRLLTSTKVVNANGFAQAHEYPYSQPMVANMVHRPASRPGAD